MSYALVTGASKGIGKSIAEELARMGNDLILVARSENTLKELSEVLKQKYSVKVDYLALDLALPNAANEVYNWCISKGYSINILVNNAGYGLWGRFDELDLSKQEEMLQLNMHTLVQLTRAFITTLKSEKKSYILNVASTAAYQAVPTLSLYAASKSFVLLFTRGIRLELKNSSISVSCLCPGPTSTNFVDRAGMSDAIKKKADAFGMSPEAVAKIAVKAMFKGKAEIVPGLLNKITVWFTAFVPKSIPENIAVNLYKN
jgi:short-subunit dehydrogenase